MIDDRPNLPGQLPEQQKLVLPGIQEDAYYPGAHTQRVYVHPDQMRSSVSPRPGNPLAKLGYLWRRDPAYKVLMVATAVVLVAGIIFATFLVSMFAQASATPQVNTATQKAPAQPTGGTDLHPTFPTPAGGQGTKNSSQPTNKGTAVVLPTLTPAVSATPTNQPVQGNLTPQIVAIPQQVRSNSVVPVTVSVGQPGVQVFLEITYDQAPNNMSGPKMTNDTGNVTLNWHVNVFSFKQHLVARVTAFAIDQNGQRVQSQTVSVEVTNRLQFGG